MISKPSIESFFDGVNKTIFLGYIVLNKGYYKSEKLINELQELCKKNLAHYSIPKEFEFRSSLPKTMIGKVDFKKLQEENNKKRKRNKAK